jgi:calcium-activated chloride channel regulator 4
MAFIERSSPLLLRLGGVAASALVVLGAGGALTESRAANSWLSRAVEITPDGRTIVMLPTNRQGTKINGQLRPQGGTSPRTVFDIVISLYNSPAGDNDANVDSGEEQEEYEAIVRFFADSVCEQSNGSHRLGKVRLFTNRNQWAAADVVWNDRQWPQANVSGFGANGLRIFFGDVFPNGSGPGTDFDMLANPEAAGYTLGHEWGHYVYGVFDEYQGSDPAETRPGFPQPSDQPTSPSIMNSQWQAVGGNFEWLNHSTSDNIGNVGRTAQGRVYGKSAWEVLVQDPSEDPKAGDLTAQPDRTRYSSLAEVAPTLADNWVREELPGAQMDCRSDLEILWVEGDIELQIVLDRSGSMEGEPITNAKQAATLLVDTTAEGESAVGVASFSRDTSITQDAPIQPIPDPGDMVKADINAIIDVINAGGATALYDAAGFALDGLIDYQATNNTSAAQVVFLLSDGGDNDSSRENESSVISRYTAADVVLFTFGFGSASPTGTLLRMANGTGGQYYFSPTDLAQITDAFLQANAVASDLQNLIEDTRTLAPGAQETVVIPVDGGLDSITLILNHTGDVDDLDVVLQDPTGMAMMGAIVCAQISQGQTSCSGRAETPTLVAGEWSVVSTSNAPVDVTATLNVSGSPNATGTYNVRVAGFEGNEVIYPDPIVLTTAVLRDLPITGVNVAASITGPDGVERTFDMRDDGTFGDGEAGDGIYSAILDYDRDGTYAVEVRVDNDSGTARFTRAGLQPAHPSADVNGLVPEPPPLPDIRETFSRVSKTNIVVAGADQANANDSFDAAIPLTPDNTSVAGVIDAAGDQDYYVINGIDTASELVVRVFNVSLGMDTNLTIFAEDRTTEVVSGATLQTNPSAAGYVYVPLAPADLTSTMYAIVSEIDPAADRGGYEISAGPAIASDVPPNAIPVATEDAGTVLEGESIQINLLANDTDADGDPLSIDGVDDANVAAMVIDNGDGTITFDTSGLPYGVAPGTSRMESFTYTVTDGSAFGTGTVVVTIEGNTPPDAVEDSAQTSEDASVTINVLANDSDPDGQTIAVSAIDDSALSGAVMDNGDGSVTYDPAGAFDSLDDGETAEDSFTYTITDSGGASSTAAVMVTVTGVAEDDGDDEDEDDNGGGGGGSLGGLSLVVLGMLLLARARRQQLRRV